MIIHQLSQGEEKSIFPLVEERLVETNLCERVNPSLAKALVTQNLVLRSAEVFSDDKEAPNAAMILTFGRLSILPEECCIITMLHVAKALREKDPAAALKLGKDMLAMAVTRARSKGCDVLRASSLVWRGGLDISSFYESSGFEIQSKEFTMLLKP